MSVQARARVTITLEIPVGDSWDDTCKMDQIYEQARNSALGELRRGFVIDGLESPISSMGADGLPYHRVQASIIGNPKVVAILVGQGS